jgi:hypothetical protein
VSQINVNAPPPSVEPVDSGDRSAAAGINMITVLIVLGVLAVIAWYLFTGPLRSIGSGTTNVNVNPPGQPTTTTTINVNPPAQNAPAPANNNPPAKPAP